MAQSPLLGGVTRAPASPAGRDNPSLGPSDNSDSGSDVAGIAGHEDGDPNMPVDRAMDDPLPRSDISEESIAAGADSDGAGSGERRSAAGDAGLEDGADIGVDQVFSVTGEALSDDGLEDLVTDEDDEEDEDV